MANVEQQLKEFVKASVRRARECQSIYTDTSFLLSGKNLTFSRQYEIREIAIEKADKVARDFAQNCAKDVPRTLLEYNNFLN